MKKCTMALGKLLWHAPLSLAHIQSGNINPIYPSTMSMTHLTAQSQTERVKKAGFISARVRSRCFGFTFWKLSYHLSLLYSQCSHVHRHHPIHTVYIVKHMSPGRTNGSQMKLQSSSTACIHPMIMECFWSTKHFWSFTEAAFCTLAPVVDWIPHLTGCSCFGELSFVVKLKKYFVY